jgi:hypothetical protein
MAAPNPFLEAIQSAPNPIPNFNELLKQYSVPTPHGVDLSQYQTGPWNFQLGGFASVSKSPAQAMQAAQALQSAQQSNSQGGFDLLSWLKNAGAAVWHDLKGGLAGAQVNEANEQGPFSVIPGFFWGLRHPGQALEAQQKLYQAVDQDVAKQHAPQWVKNTENFANHFILSAGSDPLTFTPLPIGTAAKVLKMVPGVNAGLNALKGVVSAAKESKAVKPLIDQLGKNFVKYHGASPELKSALQTRDNLMNFYRENIQKELQQMAERHALTPEEMNLLPHVWEGTETTDNPKILQAIQELRDFLENGRGNIAGQIGTNAELSTTLHDQPILQRLRANYFPHSYLDDEETVQKILEGTPTKSFSTTGPFNQAREFNTLKEAMEAGLTPELNPYVAVGKRLMQSAKALTNARLINDLLEKGIIATEEAPGLVRSNVLNSLKWLDAAKPSVVRYYVRPEDESAFRQALQPYEPKGAFVNLFDKAMGAWKWGTLLNPAVHGHNIFYNGMYLGGASPKGFAEMFRSIKNNPLQNVWYQRALKAGAVSADRNTGLDALRKTFTPSRRGRLQKVKSAVKYATHDVLWDADKALRTQLFRQAVERGMSDEEAAKFVNKFMVDYNNTTPFEEKYLTRIFPFYRWMKGNLPLQVDQWINNTPKQAWYEVVKNATSNGLSGEDATDSKINTGIRLPDGSTIMIDPYSPADEPIKLMREGLFPFLYGKVSPVVKEPIAQILNQAYYPGSTESAVVPSDKRGMTQTTITTPGAGTLDNLAARVNHAASSLLPLSGVIGSLVGAKDNLSSALGQPTKDKPGETAVEAITRLLGGFTSRDNPALDEYYQERQQQDDLKKLIARLKKMGQPVPQELAKAAYAKIPFPMTGQ